jgi:uncharacterized protein YukE
MSIRCLCIPALLILALPVFANAQSLGDVARQNRTERKESGASHLRVYTNDDLSSPSSEPAATEPAADAKDKSTDNSGKDGDKGAQTESSTEGAGKAAASETKAAKKSSIDKERAERELETQKRTDEINQRYLDRIATIRTQIAAAQTEIARLQRDQVESTNQFQRTSGTTPNIAEYQEQQRLFTEQIQAQSNLLVTLSSQLDDAQESARHAGVPHATD